MAEEKLVDMISITKLEFSQKQKKEYKKLRMIAVSVGAAGLILMIVSFCFGYRDFGSIIGIFLMGFYAYFNERYRKILLESEKTIEYANFQKELYSKLYKFFLPPLTIGAIIFMFIIIKFSLTPWLIAIYLVGSGVVAGIWTAQYEKKKFGSIKKAP